MANLQDHEISVPVSEDVDRWLESRSGGDKASFIRGLIEKERASDHYESLLAMFNAAARDLTDQDREEREQLIDGFANLS
jgi:hypothetical protein